MAQETVTRQQRPHIWQFDVLRGIAVLGVICCHASQRLPMVWLHWAGAYGWAGVDLFFVLSGFLITGILLDMRGTPHFFRNFYARRVLRIWPLYFAVIGTLLVVLPHLAPGMMRPLIQSTGGHLWLYPLFLQNLTMPDTVAGVIGITWSLAIEEQFYFVWPLLVFLLREQTLQRILVGVLIAEPLLRLVLGHAAPHYGWHIVQYTNTFTRLDGLAAGCLLTILLRQHGADKVRTWAKVTLAAAGLLVVGSVMLKFQWSLFSALGIGFGAVVALAITTHWVPRNRWLQFTGKISFGLYMLHLFVMDVLSSARIHAHLRSNAAYTVAAVVGFYGLATLSYYCFEQPILRLKRHFESERPAAVVTDADAELRLAA